MERKGVNSVQAGVGSAHRRATDSGGHAGAGVQAAKRGPSAAEAARPVPARAHTPLGPAARTYPATRRAHRGPRTAAASCQTWSLPGLPSKGDGLSCGTAAEALDYRAQARGWRRPGATAPPSRRRSAAEGGMRPGGAPTASNGARGPPLTAPANTRLVPRRSCASRCSSVASGPPRPAPACPGYSPSGSRRPLPQAGRPDSRFKDGDR
ncbi:uncharacterized protein LOC144341271 [Macaca mulatta]